MVTVCFSDKTDIQDDCGLPDRPGRSTTATITVRTMNIPILEEEFLIHHPVRFAVVTDVPMFILTIQTYLHIGQVGRVILESEEFRTWERVDGTTITNSVDCDRSVAVFQQHVIAKGQSLTRTSLKLTESSPIRSIYYVIASSCVWILAKFNGCNIGFHVRLLPVPVPTFIFVLKLFPGTQQEQDHDAQWDRNGPEQGNES